MEQPPSCGHGVQTEIQGLVGTSLCTPPRGSQGLVLLSPKVWNRCHGGEDLAIGIACFTTPPPLTRDQTHTHTPCVQQYPMGFQAGLVDLQWGGFAHPDRCSMGGLPAFNFAMASVRSAMIFACCWFIVSSLSIILLHWLNTFAKLSSNAAIFSAWTISYAAARLAKAKSLEVMRLMSRISANAAVQ